MEGRRPAARSVRVVRARRVLGRASQCWNGGSQALPVAQPPSLRAAVPPPGCCRPRGGPAPLASCLGGGRPRRPRRLGTLLRGAVRVSLTGAALRLARLLSRAAAEGRAAPVQRPRSRRRRRERSSQGRVLLRAHCSSPAPPTATKPPSSARRAAFPSFSVQLPTAAAPPWPAFLPSAAAAPPGR